MKIALSPAALSLPYVSEPTRTLAMVLPPTVV
jgi:hypothetical protein